MRLKAAEALLIVVASVTTIVFVSWCVISLTDEKRGGDAMGALATLIGAAATVFAGALAWWSSTKPERESRAALNAAIRENLSEVSEAWKAIGPLHNGSRDIDLTLGICVGVIHALKTEPLRAMSSALTQAERARFVSFLESYERTRFMLRRIRRGEDGDEVLEEPGGPRPMESDERHLEAIRQLTYLMEDAKQFDPAFEEIFAGCPTIEKISGSSREDLRRYLAARAQDGFG